MNSNSDKIIDVTDKVECGEVDGHLLPIKKCICGREFFMWDEILPAIYDKETWECPGCHRHLAFSYKITIYEVSGEISGN